MDRKYIENEHIVDRYMSGDLTVREAREFEKYCLDNPDVLKTMPIPVRLKARLAKKPLQQSETGIFPAIPSSTARAAVDAHDEGFDATDEHEAYTATYGSAGGGGSRMLTLVLGIALIGAVAGMIFFAMESNRTSKELTQTRREMRAVGV